jgi:putative MATE family efflux protein
MARLKLIKDPTDRRIVALAVPALGALAVEPLYTLTDVAIIGHLGTTPLAGLAVAVAILNVAVYASGFLAMATTSRVAFLRGADDEAGAARAAVAAYAVAIVVGTATALVIAAAAEPLSGLVGAEGEVQDAAVTYLRWSTLGLPFMLCQLAGNGHHRGMADTRTPLRIAVTSNVMNVVLELLFVYGLDAGVTGSALGTVCAQVMAGTWFLVRSRRIVARTGVGLRPDRGEAVGLVRAGGVIIIRTLALLAALTTATSTVARLGDKALGGHQIGQQVFFLLALSLDALAIPAQTFTGEALGRGDSTSAREIGSRCLRLSLGTGVIAGVLAIALAPIVPPLFSPDPEVQRAATVAMVVCGLAQPLAGVAFCFDGIFLGAGRYHLLRRTMLLALVPFGLVIAVPLVVRPAGTVGVALVWAAIAVWLSSRAGLLAHEWRHGPRLR